MTIAAAPFCEVGFGALNDAVFDQVNFVAQKRSRGALAPASPGTLLWSARSRRMRSMRASSSMPCPMRTIRLLSRSDAMPKLQSLVRFGRQPHMPFFYLSAAMLQPGAIILPGNWGRIIRQLGWQHGPAVFEIALEDQRIRSFPSLPSRLNCSFSSTIS